MLLQFTISINQFWFLLLFPYHLIYDNIFRVDWFVRRLNEKIFFEYYKLHIIQWKFLFRDKWCYLDFSSFLFNFHPLIFLFFFFFFYSSPFWISRISIAKRLQSASFVRIFSWSNNEYVNVQMMSFQTINKFWAL